jgi:hypothetical protein
MKTLVFGLLTLFLALQTAEAQTSDTAQVGRLIVSEPLAAIESLESFTAENKRKKTIPGFRVQIFNGNKQEAQRVRVAFVKAYPNIPVALTYDAPEYRVQAGDFRTRVEAEKLLAMIRQEFRGSFVVRTLIELPALP